MERSLGQQIKQARQEQGISLEEASHVTRIKEHYLRAIEKDDLDALPSPVQQRGFIRSYASFLGLEEQPLLERLSSPAGEQPAGPEAEPGDPETAPSPGGEGFLDIGSTLQEQRETLGFALSDVENQIHIPLRYLRAIEDGRLDDLPSTVQGRGMLKNYAEFLGMDADRLLLKYADVLQSRLQAKDHGEPPRAFELSAPLWLRRFFSGNIVLSVIIVLVLGAAIVWSSMQVFGGGDSEPAGTPTIPGVAQVLLPSATFTLTPTLTPTQQEGSPAAVPDTTNTPIPETITQQAQPTQPAVVAGRVNIQLIVNQRSYLRVWVDGEEAFNGRVLPGSVHVFEGQERVEILTGNAAGVEVIYNQQDLGVLGLFGEVVSRIYTAEGIATPTPTISPTPTITPTPTVTGTPTGTPTPEPVGQ